MLGTTLTLLAVWHEVELTAVVSAFIWVATFPIRKFVETIKHKFDIIDDMSSELKTQRTNCLTTLQEQGRAQIELLRSLHDAAVETNTILKLKK